MRKSTRVLAGLVTVLLAVSVGMYFWKRQAVAAASARCASDRAVADEAARAALRTVAADLLRLAAVPLAWTVREPLLRGDLDRVHEYLGRYVKEPPITRIMVADSAGLVLASTDRKDDGETLPPNLAVSSEVQVLDRPGEDLQVVAPVMGLDERIGTIVISDSRRDLELRLAPAAP